MQYDGNGNLIQFKLGSTQRDFAYDSRNRLIREGRDDGGQSPATEITLDYPIGSASLPAGQTVLEASGRVIHTRFDARWRPAQVQVRAGNPLSLTRTVNYTWDAADRRLSLADASGAKVVDYRYDPYGGTVPDAASSNVFQYAGRENDGLGLYFNRARYLKPRWGRFISQDPIGLAGWNNIYTYTNSNPISESDPSGEIAAANPVVIGAVVIAAGYTLCSSCRDAMQDSASRASDTIIQATSRARKAASTIAANIIEGAKRKVCPPKDKDPCDQQEEEDNELCRGAPWENGQRKR